MWFLAIVSAALLLAALRLTSRYYYGPKTRRLLLLDLVGSLVAGYALAHFIFFPTAAGFYLHLAGLGLAVCLFLVSALALAETMRKRRQHTYDVRLSELRVKEQELLRSLEPLDRQTRAELRRRETAESAGRSEEQHLEACRQRVDQWQRGGGAARIRTIKAEEWDREFRALAPSELTARRSRLEEELAQSADSERRAQIEVMLALATLVGGGGRVSRACSTSDSASRAVADVAVRRREIEAHLAVTRADISEWQRRLSEFLSKEIRLD